MAVEDDDDLDWVKVKDEDVTSVLVVSSYLRWLIIPIAIIFSEFL